jgi:transcriptional regulator with XRE-family HTH domain
MRPVRLTISDAFSQVVAKHREEKGLSRAALARRAGLHQTYIGLLEHGKRAPTLDTANAIAEALEIPFEELIAEAGHLQATNKRK